MQCSKCNKNNSDDSKFCSYCGNKIVINQENSTVKTGLIAGAAGFIGGIAGNLFGSKPALADGQNNSQSNNSQSISETPPTIDRVSHNDSISENNEDDIFSAYDSLTGENTSLASETLMSDQIELASDSSSGDTDIDFDLV